MPIKKETFKYEIQDGNIEEFEVNKYHILIIAVLLGTFTFSFAIVNGTFTGLFVATNGVGLDIDDIDVSSDSVTFEWSTRVESVSTLNIKGGTTAFTTSTGFAKEVSGLAPGTDYTYAIRACDNDRCEEKAGVITTKSRSAASITGAVAGNLKDLGAGIGNIGNIGSVPSALKSSVNMVLYVLVGLVVFVVAGRIGYEQFGKTDSMQGILNQGKELVKIQEFEQANQIYAQARDAFSMLEEEAKIKHYDGLMELYDSLKRHFDIREAQILGEKYSNGTISKEELQKLNDLMMQ